MKVLLAYDGSACADTAIQDLRRAGLPDGSQIRVLTVVDVYLPAPHVPTSAETLPAVADARRTAQQAFDNARTMAATAAARIAAAHPTWTVSSEAVADSPAWGLIKHADAWEPDLIVVGSHGRSLVGRLALGSVSAKVVAHAACSVRVAREPLPDRRNVPTTDGCRLVIGIDGSVGSATAVQAVAARRWPAGTKVLVLFVLDLRAVTSIVSAAAGAAVDARREAQQSADRACRELRDAGLDATAKVEDGDVRDLIVADAERWNADCIFVGAKGMSRIERFLLGSVSSAVATRARCSVEVIRHSS